MYLIKFYFHIPHSKLLDLEQISNLISKINQINKKNKKSKKSKKIFKIINFNNNKFIINIIINKLFKAMMIEDNKDQVKNQHYYLKNYHLLIYLLPYIFGIINYLDLQEIFFFKL